MKTKLLLLSAICLCACTTENPGFVSDPALPGECRAGEEVNQTLEAFEDPKLLDVLIVIDDSGAVEDFQTQLSAAIPSFLSVFDAAEYSVRVGVASTDGDRIVLAKPGETAEGCDGNDDVVVDNEDDDSWLGIAACNIVQGERPDDFDEPLKVVDGLLTQPPAGLFRPFARRLILIASKDDDCSYDAEPAAGNPRDACRTATGLSDTAAFAEKLKGLTVTPKGIEVIVLSGPPATQGGDDVRPVCNSSVGPVYAGNRLFEVVSELGESGHFLNACTEDFVPTLTQLANTLVNDYRVEFCASRPMAHEPLSVIGVSEDDRIEVPLGEQGFEFLGSTSSCENGVVSFGPFVTKLEAIEVTYCAL